MPLEFGRFNNFTLLEVIPVTHDTSLFRFRAAHQIPDSQNIPIEDRKSKSKVHLSTNEYYPNGSVSSMIHSLEPGKDFIIARGPVLSFPYTQNMTEKLVMIAGGTGITPMYQLIKQILRNPHDKTSINLDILLGNECMSFNKIHHVIQNGATNVSSRGYGAIHGGLLMKREEPVVLVCGPDGMVEWLAGEKKSENNQGPLLGVLKRAGYTPQQVFKF
ncbi:ferredoxin reductase-like protein [Rhizoclosmatium globosum]|uniref:Ferredoxin reductase-like protein n=1 Tax=Rhizoclosmatium globosum TaxID=329046 RepID=A0A1Y2BLZ1_9FUNG|nr:ferredoxin reductase-like protein [Rhizoclosmatium globosum]|eukprot:ORY35165.1 ferredoxin reductase-like protein [Rhizoclosmatium globosum]